MNRAVRSIPLQPSLRRHRRRMEQTAPLLFNITSNIHNNNTTRKRCLSSNRTKTYNTKHSFSSTTFDNGDTNSSSSSINSSGSNENSNRILRRLRQESKRRRKAYKQKQRANNNNNNSGSGSGKTLQRSGNLSVFASIHEAQDAMQDLLDRLVIINNHSESWTKIPPMTVRNLADWNNNNNNNNNIRVRDPQEYYDSSYKERASIFWESGKFFDALVRSVNKGLLSPSRKHGKDLSQLAECLLYVCSQQQNSHHHGSSSKNNNNDNNNPLLLDTSEVIGAIEVVLRVLEVDWNLDVSHRHFEHAIAAACNYHEWEVASDLFEKQIDPNAGGSPVQLSIENPLGLYAMAQRYQQQQQQHQQLQQDQHETSEESASMVAEQIMDAVQRLGMVSSQDQTTYVLAAGNALGYSGCWKELNDYRKSSVLSERYGTPLIAAVLRACLLCEEYDAALEILVEENILSRSLLPISENIVEGNDEIDLFAASSSPSNLKEEWQWGGERDRADPLIRDLAMQVIGGASSMVASSSSSNEGDLDRKIYDYCDSRLVLELFRQSLEEGHTISLEALLGVVEACEKDENWRGALSVLRTILKEEEITIDVDDSNTKLASWIVPSERLSIVERDQVHGNNSIDAMKVLPNLGPILASVMRNCNSSSNFGLSLFALKLFQTQLLRSTDSDIGDGDDGLSSPEEGIAKMLSEMNISNSSQDHEELLVASMVALSGLRCHKNAMRLYEQTKTDNESSPASFLYQHASMNQKHYGTSVLGNPWLSAHNHIDRLTKAGCLVRTILRENNNTGAGSRVGAIDRLQDRQRDGIEELLACAMNSCTNVHQPDLSLYLLRWMEEDVFSSHRDAKSFWEQSNRDLVSHVDVEEHCYGDSVTAETILAHRWTKDVVRAIELFEGVLEKHTEDDLVRWRKTIGAGLTAMMASGRGTDALRVFEVLDGDSRSNASYTTVGKHLSKVKDWKELIQIYRNATTEGYSSEELGLLAMRAVTSTRVDNRLPLLRTIVDDCSNSAGLDSKQWTMAKYWELKRTLGFHHARLLMWWNKEERAPLDEVNLAIKEFYNEKAKRMRPKNDVVRAIFYGAQQREQLGLEHEKGYDKVPRSTDRWAELLGEVLEAVRESPVRYDPNFVDSVIHAYQSLGKHKECIGYVSDVLEVEGTRIRRSTLEVILESAKAEQAFGLCQDIEVLLSTERSSVDGNDGEYSPLNNLLI